MVQSWLILSPFVLVPGILDEPRFYGPHFLDALSVSVSEMTLQPPQWHLPPPHGKHVFGEDESHSWNPRMVITVGGWCLLVKQARGLLKGGPEPKATVQTGGGKAFWTAYRHGTGANELIWSPGRKSQADMGPHWPDSQTESPPHLLAMQGWVQGTREGIREGRKPQSSSHTGLELQSVCRRSRWGKEDPGSIPGSIISQGWWPPRAGWEPLGNTPVLNSSHQPTAPGAAHTWLVCP